MEIKMILLILVTVLTSITFFLIFLPNVKHVYLFFFKSNHYSKMGESSKIRLVHQLFDAVAELSKHKTGAIITIENKDSIEDFRTDGIIIDANVSAALIISLFHKNSPLHDGAIVIKNRKITYAATYYKITSKSIDNKFGARHRAAMGISEQTDALTIIVSEETGGVTFARHGRFEAIPIKEFQEILTAKLKEG